MWLLVSFLIGLQCKVHGLHFSDNNADHDLCIAMIDRCEDHRQPFGTSMKLEIGMFTNIEALEKACSDQNKFLQCIDEAEKFCREAGHLYFANKMIEYRRFVFDICRPSPWQQLYLKEARCINKHSAVAIMNCVVTGLENLDFGLECKYKDSVRDCSVAAIQQKCGYYAGDILKRLLNFQRLPDKACARFQAEDSVEQSCITTPEYGTTETSFDVLHAVTSYQNSGNEVAEKRSDTERASVEKLKLSFPSLEDSLSGEATTSIHFDNPMDESLSTTESLPVTKNSNEYSKETSEIEFPALLEDEYIHKNRTTFVLYKHAEKAHMQYVGCGEADIFWLVLSPLKRKYCILTDLKSEHSSSVFNCTIRIDAPCSPHRRGLKKFTARVLHHRYITVLTPPDSQRLDDVAILYARYFRFYANPLMFVPKRRVSVWTGPSNKQPKPAKRLGSLEIDDERNEVLERHDGGSGQKREILEDQPQYEGDEGYRNWGEYYPSEEDIYFSEPLRNDIIYIEDDRGDLISLRDYRSPIYSNSLYQPHSLFRPRIGQVPSNENSMGPKLKLALNSLLCRQISDHIQPGMFIDAPCIESIGPLQGMKLETFEKHPSPTNFNFLFREQYSDPEEVYVVTPSAKIERYESVEADEVEEIFEDEDFVADRTRYPLVKEGYCSATVCSDESGDFN